MAKLNDSIVPLSTVGPTFGAESKVDRDSSTVLVWIWKRLGEGYPVRLPVRDADSQHLVSHNLPGGYIIRKTPEGYALDKVSQVLGTMAVIQRDAWIFDRNDTEPGLVTSPGEWEFLDSVWEEISNLSAN